MESLNDVAASVRRIDADLSALGESVSDLRARTYVPSPRGCDEPKRQFIGVGFDAKDVDTAYVVGLVSGVMLAYYFARYLMPRLRGAS